jgi:hypothetical protein
MTKQANPLRSNVANHFQVTQNGQVLAPGERVRVTIKNFGIELLYVKKGADCGEVDYTDILVADSGTEEGNGGSVSWEGWLGSVAVYAVSESPRCLVVEDRLSID